MPAAKSGKRTTAVSCAPRAADRGGETDADVLGCFALDASGRLSPGRLLEVLGEAGILRDDPRIAETVAHLDRVRPTPSAAAEPLLLTAEEFTAATQHNRGIIERAACGELMVPDFPALVADLRRIYEEVRADRSGSVAAYIPQLARVNPDQFAISVCTVDGQRFSIGDAEVNFCLQSVSKTVGYCLTLEEHGPDTVHRHMGREPSGQGFNELTFNKAGLPHNPMINAGAIMSCALIQRGLDAADRFDFVAETWKRLAGGRSVGFNNSVYLSERSTADRNFALGYSMRERGAFPPGTDLLATLEFYIQCCSIEVDARQLAVAAASLANAGVCPLTEDPVFSTQTVRHCLSLMSSCGMYDFSGEFAFTIGLPAKSGVSGALMLVVPQLMGIAIWSPRLDGHGNSVRGIEVCRRLVDCYNVHTYDLLTGTGAETGKRDPRLKRHQSATEGIVGLCFAASRGDVNEIRRLAACNVPLDAADYDGRTALHLAAAEGHRDVVEFLLSRGVDPRPVDRWGGTPLDDADRSGHQELAGLLAGAADGT
ncbi:glutaminase A [Streptomyces sp. UNOB3_S3]|uniref:glutaminase A n=1 Tax=Streptomyces sp. UNOB3_S3 TaxID=2871682 RepID=UPI001E3AE637|nr:glutaminase A [Streptomyces sp. UNOB3_S3]MCC3777888.1 glutaminase A [Streptomyces sp. UNOB3_S3]